DMNIAPRFTVDHGREIFARQIFAEHLDGKFHERQYIFFALFARTLRLCGPFFGQRENRKDRKDRTQSSQRKGGLGSTALTSIPLLLSASPAGSCRRRPRCA